MKKIGWLVAVALATALGATPVLALDWTGQVVENYPDSYVFVIAQGEQEMELWLGPEPSQALLQVYGQLQVGDTVKVTFDEEAIASSIEVVQRATPGQVPAPRAEGPEPADQGKSGGGY